MFNQIEMQIFGCLMSQIHLASPYTKHQHLALNAANINVSTLSSSFNLVVFTTYFRSTTFSFLFFSKGYKIELNLIKIYHFINCK